MEIYQNPACPVPERVDDLLARMTLEDKVGQMIQADGRHEPDKTLHEMHVGSFLHVIGQEAVALQKQAAQIGLGIPLIFGIDAIHGHAFWPTATVFPTQLNMSCAWNPSLMEQIGRITAIEAAYTGMHWTFSPVLCLARDLRWGRIDETFGEDPYLVGVLGAALVRGYQGNDLSAAHSILACAKHYAGYPAARGGRDAAETDLTRRGLLSTYLPPFQAAVEAGCGSFMTAYEAIDGLPCTANRWLLDQVLKKEWGFDGFVVTDWDNVARMCREQKVCATLEQAAQRAAEAGNDMIMTTPAFYQAAINLVRSGQLDEAVIDWAVRRILTIKFRLGLFDHKRYPDLEGGQTVIGCAAHRQVALEAAYQSMVLLQNSDHLLPLNTDKIKRIAVIGPNADDPAAQLGDWVSWSGQLGERAKPRARESVVTVLDGIRRRADAGGIGVEYARGCDVIDPDESDIPAAVELARQSDLAVVVLGDNLQITGEGRDRANLDLSGGQQKLLEAVYAAGTPVVLVLVNSKPLTIPWAVAHILAIVQAGNPGLEGGTALAGILFGDRNPSGRLTLSWPYHVGQQPVYYNQEPGWHAIRYADMPPDPLFAFGYGLSYTNFAYSHLETSPQIVQPNQDLCVSVDVTNTGGRDGVEIVQLYINDVYSSVTTPTKELKAFARVELAAGETKTVSLCVPFAALSLVNQNLERVVEPGEFEVMVGGSLRDQDLLQGTFYV